VTKSIQSRRGVSDKNKVPKAPGPRDRRYRLNFVEGYDDEVEAAIEAASESSRSALVTRLCVDGWRLGKLLASGVFVLGSASGPSGVHPTTIAESGSRSRAATSSSDPPTGQASGAELLESLGAEEIDKLAN
jgi:hypothetical protein